jgi:hypothetical protein
MARDAVRLWWLPDSSVRIRALALCDHHVMHGMLVALHFLRPAKSA